MIVNRELFRQVHELISAHPEKHNQADWTAPDACGTKHCVGGWAIALTHPEATSIRRVLPIVDGGQRLSLGSYAAELLGLKPHEAYALFYCTQDEEAVRIAEEFADWGLSDTLGEVMDRHGIDEGNF